MATTKTTVNLPTAEVEAIKTLAARRSVSFTHALRQAIQTELFVQRLIDEGAKLLAQTRSGDLQQLVFTQAENARAEEVAAAAVAAATSTRA